MRAILGLPNAASIEAITHKYHLLRTQRMFREENDECTQINLSTPEQIVEMHAQGSHPIHEFVRDVVAAAKPSDKFLRKEQMMEWIYGPLHTFSRLGEKLTGWNLEMHLADRTRSKK